MVTSEHLLALYETGRYRTAYRAAQRSGWWQRAASVEDTLLVARILRQMGNTRRARYLTLRTWRANREHLDARFWYATEIASPVRRWLRMEQLGDPTHGSDDDRQNWFLLRALTLSTLHDFEAADRWWSRAAEHGDTPWKWSVRSMIDADRDDLDAAMGATEQALSLHPWYSPAIRSKVQHLQRLQRPDEALALAREAQQHLESPFLPHAAHFMQWERGDYQGALRSLEHMVALAPEMEQPLHDWLVVRFAQVAYRAGDRTRPRRLANAVGTEELAKLADQCEDTSAGERVHLDVPLVPQNHNTCGPASLTAIARYWNAPVQHEGLVEEICRDGTTAFSERKWAVAEGWHAREFTMTWESTRELIDAGVPFAFVTTFEVAGHLQAAMGYDPQFEAVVVRDPSALSTVEIPWSALEKHEAAFGPRAFIIMPRGETARLDGIELPDVTLYDQLFAVESALDAHNRPRAASLIAELEQVAPGHILTLRARRSLAYYDADPRGTFDWTEAMLAQHPDDHRLRVIGLASSHNCLTTAERVARAEAYARDSDSPILLAELARLLDGVPDRRHRALAMLWRALHRAPTSATNHRALADRLWGEGQRDRATDLYRFASCLSRADESAAWTYFLACRGTNRRDEGFAHLQARATAAAATTAHPARTLADAHDCEDQPARAIEVLEAAEAKHGDDGAFLLSLAEQHLCVGAVDRARDLLRRAEHKVRRGLWLRTAARLSLVAGEREHAIEHWKTVTELEPLALDARRAMASFISASEGAQAAASYVRELTERFPNHMVLGQLLYDYLCEYSEDEALVHLRSFSDRHPEDHWAHRELAITLARTGDTAAAYDSMERARALGDGSPEFHCSLGAVHAAHGDAQAARDAYAAALDEDVDTTYALTELIQLAPDTTATEAVLAQMFQRLMRQATSGPGLMAYASNAVEWLEPHVLDEHLVTLARRHAHVFEAHLACVRMSMHRGNDGEAMQRASDLTERFPLVAGSWRTLANVHEDGGRNEDRVAALQRALELSPRWGTALRELSTAYADQGDAGRARQVLERAIAQDPLDASNRGFLAELLWNDGDRRGAVEHIKTALELQPGYRWGWGQLAAWTSDPSEAIAFARGLASSRGATAAVWAALAELLQHAPLASRIECLDEAIRRNPACVEYHDVKAELLCGAERFDEALAACAPPLWGDSPPRELRARAAWIHYAQGQDVTASRELLDIVRDSPDYPWAIRTLLEWSGDAGGDRHLEMCRELVAAAPRSATALGHLGDALQHTKDYEGAESALLRALELAPRDEYALLTLCDVYFEQDRLDEAEQALAKLDDQDPTVAMRRGWIAAARGDGAQTCEALSTLLRRPDVQFGFVRGLLDRVQTRSLRRQVRDLLRYSVRDNHASGSVGLAWLVFVGLRLPAPVLWRRLAGLPVGSEARRLAIVTYIEDLGERGQAVRFAAARLFMGRALGSTTPTWSAVTYALLGLGHYRRAVRWCRDWKSREGVKGWMLWNLSVAARATGRFSLAFDTHRSALALPDDRLSFQHRLWLSLHEAVDGDVALAESLLDAARGPAWDLEQKYLARVAQALIEWRRDDGDVSERYRVVAHALATAKAQLGPGHPDMHRVHRWAHKRVARHLGPVRGLIWRVRMW